MKYILLFLCILSLSCKYNVANPVGTLRDYTEGSGIIYDVSSSATAADIEMALKKNKHSLGKYLIKVSTSSSSDTKILTNIANALKSNSSFNNVEVDISKLTNVNEIPKGVFKDVKNLGSISLSDKVTKINEEAFSGCSSLSDIRFSNGLTDILDGAFSNCSALTLVMLSSEKLTNIGTNAFSGCSSLVSIILSASLTNICNDAFTNCTKLANVEYLGSSTNSLKDCKPFETNPQPNNLYLPNISSGVSSFLGKSWTNPKYKQHIPS